MVQTVRTVPKRTAENAASICNGIEVRESTLPNAGLGAFACIRFAVHEYVTEYDGEIIDWDEAKERRSRGRDGTHIVRLELGHAAIDGKNVQNELGRGAASFINDPIDKGRVNCKLVRTHCLKGVSRSSSVAQSPAKVNTRSSASTVHNLQRCFAVATKPICPGDELFIDYGADYWDTVASASASASASAAAAAQ